MEAHLTQVFSTQIFLIGLLDLSNVLHGCVKFATWICHICYMYFSITGNGQKSLAIVGGVAVLLLFVGCVALILIKRGKAGIAVVVKEDINETYSDYYSDPNAVVEMIDYNEYYSKDYEAGSTATRDNNSQYYY